VLAGSIGGALAAKPAGLAQGESAPAATAPNAPAYAVEGFRSARFGMSEADVRKAIAADFKLTDKVITRDTNPVEHTTILTVSVPDLLAEAGPARVSYIFGYARHQLIYVNVVWVAPKKEGAGNSLAPAAAALRNYFLAYSFKPEGQLRDVTLNDGSVLLFQGADQKNRTVSLVTGEGPGESGTDRQWVLRLSYIENPTQPDVYRIKPGTF
jgi:hypothetical protein